MDFVVRIKVWVFLSFFVFSSFPLESHALWDWIKNPVCDVILSKRLMPKEETRESNIKWENDQELERSRLEDKIEDHKRFVRSQESASESARNGLIHDLNHQITIGNNQGIVSQLRSLFRQVEMAAIKVKKIRSLKERDPEHVYSAEEKRGLYRAYILIGNRYSDYRAARMYLQKVSKNENGYYEEEQVSGVTYVLSQIGINDEAYGSYPVMLSDPETGERVPAPTLEDVHEIFLHPVSLLQKLRNDLRMQRFNSLTGIFNRIFESSFTKKIADYGFQGSRWANSKLPDGFSELTSDLFEVYNDKRMLRAYHRKIQRLKLLNTTLERKVMELREMIAYDNQNELLITFARIVSEDRFWDAMVAAAEHMSKDQSHTQTYRNDYKKMLKQMKDAFSVAEQMGDLSAFYPAAPSERVARWLKLGLFSALYYGTGPWTPLDHWLWNGIDATVLWLMDKGFNVYTFSVEQLTQFLGWVF